MLSASHKIMVCIMKRLLGWQTLNVISLKAKWD